MWTPREFVFRLVGTTFAEGYPNTVFRCIEMLSDGPVAARLHRVPTNEFDPNAVAVICVAAGGRVGWMPRHIAARLAPTLDAGTVYEAVVLEHVEHPEHPDNPGMNVRVTRRDAVAA